MVTAVAIREPTSCGMAVRGGRCLERWVDGCDDSKREKPTANGLRLSAGRSLSLCARLCVFN